MAKKKAKKVSAKSKPPAKKMMSKKSLAKAKKSVSAASRSQSSAGSSRPKWVPPGANPLSPILVLRDVEAALDFYQKAFGFKLRNVMKGPDNSILHAEMTHVDSQIMMGPESPERGAFAPTGPSPVTLYILVADVDAIADQARLHGGNIVQPPTDMFWGDRTAVIIDPEGHKWMVATHVKDVPFDEMVPPSTNIN
ncbi:VOC family protein [bacterium]|nr:VOC family protein [bacterium]